MMENQWNKKNNEGQSTEDRYLTSVVLDWFFVFFFEIEQDMLVYV